MTGNEYNVENSCRKKTISTRRRKLMYKENYKHDMINLPEKSSELCGYRSTYTKVEIWVKKEYETKTKSVRHRSTPDSCGQCRLVLCLIWNSYHTLTISAMSWIPSYSRNIIYTPPIKSSSIILVPQKCKGLISMSKMGQVSQNAVEAKVSKTPADLDIQLNNLDEQT